MAADTRAKRIKTDALESENLIDNASMDKTDKGQPEIKKQKKKKPPLPPTPVLPGALPDSPSVWENAVVLIDKPKGWTSFDVCGKIRGQVAGLLGKRNRHVKVGHAGTLDPMATGLLIVCVGQATKGIDAFVAMQKEYSGILRLGEGTPSYDAESEVSETLPWEHITDDVMFNTRDSFLGEIDQLPPMFSAIRVGGKRLYEAARQGKEVERSSRRITVDRFDLERVEPGSQDVKFYISCSKGTYIRSLAYDLGKALGTAAHLTALRRESIGEYNVKNAWNIEELSKGLKNLREKVKEEKEAAAAAAAEDGDKVGEEPQAV